MDNDGTISIPWWLKVAMRFIPAPWGAIVTLIVNIIDQLPAPKKAAVVNAMAKANLKGENAELAQAIHDAVVNYSTNHDGVR